MGIKQPRVASAWAERWLRKSRQQQAEKKNCSRRRMRKCSMLPRRAPWVGVGSVQGAGRALGARCSRPARGVWERACQRVEALLVLGTARTELAANAPQKLYGRVAQRKGHPGDSRGVQEEGLGGAQCQFSFCVYRRPPFQHKLYFWPKLWFSDGPSAQVAHAHSRRTLSPYPPSF